MAIALETPKSYMYYGTEYDFDDLRLRVYSTLDDFISSIKYGKKNRSEITTAVNNLMDGLASGRVTVGNNSLHDSLGEYRNANKDKHDAYGMATAHILLCMTYNIAPIEKEEKQSYTPAVAGKWLNNKLFGTDKPNSSLILLFVNLDLPIDGKRTNIERTKNILPYIQDYYNNFDKYTENYDISDEDKLMYKSYLELAIEDAKSDKSFTENEYLNLSHIFGNNNWDQYFTTSYEAPKVKRMVGNTEVPDNYIEVLTKGGNFYVNPNYWKDENLLEIFNVFMQGLYGDDNVKDTDIDLLSPDVDTDDEDAIKNILDDYPDKLINELKVIFNNESGNTQILDSICNTILESKYGNDSNKAGDVLKLAITYALRYLASNNDDVEAINGVFLFPQFTRNGIILAYDYNNNKLYWTSERKSKQFMNKALEEFLRATQSSNLNIISNFKIGGILKFNKGNKVLKGLNGITDWNELVKTYNTPEDYKSLNYETEWDYSNGLYNPNYTTWYEGDNPSTTPIDSKNTSKNKGMYSIPNINVNSSDDEKKAYKKTIKEMESDPYYQRITNEAFDENGNLTDLGKLYMHHYDELVTQANNGTLPDYSFFDKDGNLRTSWTTSEDIYGNPGVTYNNAKDYWKAIRGHLLAGQGHNIYPLIGKRYFYTNNEGKRVYVSEKEALNFNPQQIEGNVREGPITWTDYEIKALEKPKEEEKKDELEDDGSDVGPNSPLLPQNPSNWYEKLFPGVLATGRLAGTIANNNRAYKVLNRALHPYLLNTYERYSPVTGEFGLMLAYNLLAAALNRLADRNATSDASLNTASRLFANMLANLLRQQGFLKDNDEIKRTATEALLRQEDNVARRTLVANANRKSINNTNYLKAALKAEHIKQNWSAWDNYLGGIEKRLRTDQQELKDFYRDFSTRLALNNALNLATQQLYPLQLEMQRWLDDDANKDLPITAWPKYYQYLRLASELNNWVTNMGLLAAGNAWGINTPSFDSINTIMAKYAPKTSTTATKKAKQGIKLIKRRK